MSEVEDETHTLEDQRDRLVAHVRMLATLMRDCSESAFRTLDEIESGVWFGHRLKADRREGLKPTGWDRKAAEWVKARERESDG